MILPEDEVICEDIYADCLGFNALYDTCADSELAPGVIVTAVIGGTNYLFQLDSATNILKESSFPVMEGTMFEYLESHSPEDDEVDYFSISSCRFPTKEELEWYNLQKTI